jgi:pimeloyl-ACP methyl ester carboxylesterase
LDELWVTAEDTRLHLRVWGKPNGDPVLCWHGVGLTNRGSLFLNEAGPQLASDHDLRILALDAPGFGSSPPVEREAYHAHALADLVPPLLDALGLARAAFIGFSWGADIGCHVAARHSDPLSALVLLDAGYADPPLDPALDYDERVERLERQWHEACAPSWDAISRRLRANARRWSPAVEAGWRAGWKEKDGRFVPSRQPWLVAAVEHGVARNGPSSTYPLLAARGRDPRDRTRRSRRPDGRRTRSRARRR